ncbi:prosystemin isoform X3 [Solanum tuberosum]|uniref:Prosystemin n=1 Tax=Solanum tuberosum TaxID=4113 RepID=M1CYC2_SOLTU|nr:PREDICTED: systemin-like isoform X3 [Solanum tuberosum]
METPSYDIKNKGDDMQEELKVKLHHEKGGDEKEKIIEKETPSQDIKNKDTITSYVLRDDAQEKLKVEYEEEEYEKEKIVEKGSPSQDINNKGDDPQEKPMVEHEEGDEKETPSQDIIKIEGEGAQEITKVVCEEREKIVVQVDLAVHSTPPSKRDPPKMQTDNNKL